MRKTIFRLALLGTVAAVPALAQPSPEGNPPSNAANDPRPAMTTAPGPERGAVNDSTTGATSPTRDTGSSSSGNAAVRIDEGTRTANTPAPGANSFTEGQARSRIEAAGFTNVQDLQKDDQGIWRGKAQRSGQQVSVALDFQGNVVPNAGR